MNDAALSTLIGALPAIISAVAAALWSKRQAAMARDKMKADIESKQRRMQAELLQNQEQIRTENSLVASSTSIHSWQHLEQLQQELTVLQTFITDMQAQQRVTDSMLQDRVSVLYTGLQELLSKNINQK